MPPCGTIRETDTDRLHAAETAVMMAHLNGTGQVEETGAVDRGTDPQVGIETSAADETQTLQSGRGVTRSREGKF